MALGEVRRLVFCLIKGGLETVISGPVTFFEVGGGRKLSTIELQTVVWAAIAKINLSQNGHTK